MDFFTLFYGDEKAKAYLAALGRANARSGGNPKQAQKLGQKILSLVANSQKRERAFRIASILADEDETDVPTLLACMAYFGLRPDKGENGNGKWLGIIEKAFGHDSEVVEIVKNTFQIREVPVLFQPTADLLTRGHFGQKPSLPEEHHKKIRQMVHSKIKDRRAAANRLARFIDQGLESLRKKDIEEQEKVRVELDLVYEGLALELGLKGLYNSLQDLRFQLTEPEEYEETKRRKNLYDQAVLEDIGKKTIADKRGRERVILEHFGKKVRDAIPANLREQCVVTDRPKTTFAIYEKGQRKPEEYSDYVNDPYGFRVIVFPHLDEHGVPMQNDIQLCAQVSKAMADAFRGFIVGKDNFLNTANIKKSGYQAKHYNIATSENRKNVGDVLQLKEPSEKVLCYEIQILSKSMYDRSLNDAYKGRPRTDEEMGQDIFVYEKKSHEIFRLQKGATPYTLLSTSNVRGFLPDLRGVTIERTEPFVPALPEKKDHTCEALISGDVVSFRFKEGSHLPKASTLPHLQATRTAAIGAAGPFVKTLDHT